jgi:hypothetical protein
VPGAPAAPVHHDDPGAVARAVAGLGPLARRVHAGVLKQDDGVAAGSGGAIGGQRLLQRPRFAIVDDTGLKDVNGIR